MALSGETFVTPLEFTFIWFFACMDPQVGLEVSLLCKRFSAPMIGTLKWFLSSLFYVPLHRKNNGSYMSPNVDGQSSDSRIFFATERTNVRLFTRVGQNVTL